MGERIRRYDAPRPAQAPGRPPPRQRPDHRRPDDLRHAPGACLGGRRAHCDRSRLAQWCLSRRAAPDAGPAGRAPARQHAPPAHADRAARAAARSRCAAAGSSRPRAAQQPAWPRPGDPAARWAAANDPARRGAAPARPHARQRHRRPQPGRVGPPRRDHRAGRRPVHHHRPGQPQRAAVRGPAHPEQAAAPRQRVRHLGSGDDPLRADDGADDRQAAGRRGAGEGNRAAAARSGRRQDGADRPRGRQRPAH